MAKDHRKRKAEILRDTLHNYLIKTEYELDDHVYFTRLKFFIELVEGRRKEAYMDGIRDPANQNRFISVRKFNRLSKETQEKLIKKFEKNNKRKDKKKPTPIITVGIGLNINPKSVRQKYDKILGQPGLMQEIYDGKAELTDDQISIIFRECVEERFKHIRNYYGKSWNKLRANERIVIHSLFFNTYKLARPKTKFCTNILKYVETNDKKYLEAAVYEVVEKSNPPVNGRKNLGIQNRRNAEGALLSSHLCSTYTKPCEAPNSHMSEIVAYPGKTVMPLELKGSFQRGANADYFIWRTEMDHKVREEHVYLEGKVFHKDNPPSYMPSTAQGCRCHAEIVPDYVVVMGEKQEIKAFELYLRTGINLHRIFGGH